VISVQWANESFPKCSSNKYLLNEYNRPGSLQYTKDYRGAFSLIGKSDTNQSIARNFNFQLWQMPRNWYIMSHWAILCDQS
jgi:hypothetical protein